MPHFLILLFSFAETFQQKVIEKCLQQVLKFNYVFENYALLDSSDPGFLCSMVSLAGHILLSIM